MSPVVERILRKIYEAEDLTEYEVRVLVEQYRVQDEAEQNEVLAAVRLRPRLSLEQTLKGKAWLLRQSLTPAGRIRKGGLLNQDGINVLIAGGLRQARLVGLGLLPTGSVYTRYRIPTGLGAITYSYPDNVYHQVEVQQ